MPVQITIPAEESPGTYVVTVTGTASYGVACDPSGAITVDVPMPDLDFELVPDADEIDPGGFLCVNDDDDNDNGVPDKDEPGPTAGEDDLQSLTLSLPSGAAGTVTLSCESGCGNVRLYQNADRSSPVTLPQVWTVPGETFPKEFYVEGFASSVALRDIELKLLYTGIEGPCQDRVKLTVIKADLDAVTSGTDPIPFNPAVVAPMTPMALDNGVLFWDANSFALTTLQPDVDLTQLPVTWAFQVTSGSLNPTAAVVAAVDKRSARLEIPFPSFGNLGDGRMEFRVDALVCADVDTLIKNVQPDLEPGDFRFQVKAHLCNDGAGVSTSRTDAEVRAIMSDVTKVLSQCGIIVTTSQVVTTQVPTFLVDDLGSAEKGLLFDYDQDDTDIDIYFVVKIEAGATAGITLAPFPSLLQEAGIAIADEVGPEGGPFIPLDGQNVVRTVAHEITHYLLNHFLGDSDHSSAIVTIAPVTTISCSTIPPPTSATWTKGNVSNCETISE